jgi:hypothetical protein
MPSLQLLSFLVHGLRQTPVEFVVTYRSDEPPQPRLLWRFFARSEGDSFFAG